MLRLRSVFPAVVAAALGCATRGPIARTERARTEMRALERDYLDALSRRDPLEAAAPGSLRGADRAVVRDDDLAAIAAWREADDGFLARARAIDGRVLAGTPDGIARALLVEALEGARGARACRFELWQVSPDGWRALAEVQLIRTVASRAHVSATARRIGIQIESLREGVRLGYVATRENVERVLEALDRLLAAPPASWPYALAAVRDGDPPPGPELAGAIERELLPAMGRYRDFLRDEYLERARRRPSLLALPDGESCYRAAVRQHVTLELDPQAIHETGLARVQELHLEMRRIAERSLAGSDMPDLLRRLREESSLGSSARADVASRGPMPRDAASPAALGALGPEIARYVPSAAFVGGWALYSERLALERRPSSANAERLGGLAREALRAARLVVDPGVNVLGWRREHAIEYLVANAGLSPEFAADEVDRCAARPGEATAAALGALEILRLRSEAERALGRRFDLRAFHDALLESGAVTLPMLRERVARFVRERFVRERFVRERGGVKRGR